ncbi:MAG TPA: glycosyltransferase family 4 protein [Syntrophales bacterium]|nr:glycosyltransferase family 4 protein [Syntrophales bacterium]
MKILFVAHSFRRGGAEKCLFQLVERAQVQGIDCRVAGPADGPYLEDYRGIGVKIKIIRSGSLFRNRNNLGLWRNAGNLLASTSQIISYIRQFRPDLIFTSTSSVLSGAVAAKIAGVPHVWHIHENFEMVRYLYFIPVDVLRPVYAMLSKKIIFVSNPAMQSFYPGGHPKAEVIHNGVDQGLFGAGLPEQREPAPIRKILFLGALEHRKGADLLLNAFSRVKAEFPSAEIHLYGDGKPAYIDYLKKLVPSQIKESVGFEGYCRDIPGALLNHDLVVVPSRAESFSLVTVEAMLAGLPVIATVCGGPEELIRNGISGRLIAPGDADLLAKAIMDLMRDPAGAFALGREARKTALREFDLNRQLGLILDAIDKTAGAGDRSVKPGRINEEGRHCGARPPFDRA